MTWQLAGVVLALFAGIPALWLLWSFRRLDEPAPQPVRLTVSGIAIATFTWGAMGVIRRLYSVDRARRSAMAIRLAAGVAGAGACIGAALAVALRGNKVLGSLAMVPVIYAVVVVGRAMTDSNEEDST